MPTALRPSHDPDTHPLLSRGRGIRPAVVQEESAGSRLSLPKSPGGVENMADRPRVWISGPVADAALAPLQEVAEIVQRERAERATVEEMMAGARGTAGVLPVNGAPVNAQVLDA